MRGLRGPALHCAKVGCDVRFSAAHSHSSQVSVAVGRLQMDAGEDVETRGDGCPASLCLCSLKWEGAFVWRAVSSLVKQNLSPPQAVMELITKMPPDLLKRLINRFEDQSFSEVITFWCNVMSPAKLVFLVSSTGNRAYCDPWLLYLRGELAVWLKIMCIWQKDHKASVLSLNSLSQIPFAGRMHLFCLIGQLKAGSLL